MTRVLLDTQAFLLWVSGSDRLTPRRPRSSRTPDARCCVSVVSAWEIAIKAAAGKLEIEGPAEESSRAGSACTASSRSRSR